MPKLTWDDHHLPVLRAVVEMTDEGAWDIEPDEIAQRLGFDEDQVKAALWALAGEMPPFFDFEDLTTFGGRNIGGICNPTGHARRTVGDWPPTVEVAADRLVRALAQAADKAPDAETRGGLKKFTEWLGSAGRDVAVDVAGAILTKSAGLG